MTEHGLVYIVDDDDDLRQILCFLLETVGLAVSPHPSAEDFLTSFNPIMPGCILLDVRMPVMSGLELLKHLNKISCLLPVIMLSAHGDVEIAVQAMKSGAFDFIEKPFNNQLLLEKVQDAVRFSVKNFSSHDQRREMEKKVMSLSMREKQILEMVASGKTNKEISNTLNIGVKTVEAHRSQMMKKMDVSNLADLIKKTQIRDPL